LFSIIFINGKRPAQNTLFSPKRGTFIITLTVVLLKMVSRPIAASLKPITYIASIVYVLDQHRRRNRTWEEFGLEFQDFNP